MQIPIKKILDFYALRTKTHIECVNYFAGLLGYHFPEHDGDKMLGTIRTGYAHVIYAKYHPGLSVPQTQQELYDMAREEHHKTQPHHLEYYNYDVSKLSDITLIEMICDWHSASFEQRFITHEDPIGYSVYDFFSLHLSHLDWSEHQVGLIHEILDFLDIYTSHQTATNIWAPVLRAV